MPGSNAQNLAAWNVILSISLRSHSAMTCANQITTQSTHGGMIYRQQVRSAISLVFECAQLRSVESILQQRSGQLVQAQRVFQ